MKIVLLVIASSFAVGCGGQKQICECASAGGGVTPATAEEEDRRGDAVQECLEAHGGGTVVGCTAPPTVDRAPPEEGDDAP